MINEFTRNLSYITDIDYEYCTAQYCTDMVYLYCTTVPVTCTVIYCILYCMNSINHVL